MVIGLVRVVRLAVMCGRVRVLMIWCWLGLVGRYVWRLMVCLIGSADCMIWTGREGLKGWVRWAVPVM